MILTRLLREIKSGRVKIVDMSHKVSSTAPTWSGNCGFEMEYLMNYKEDLFCVQKTTLLNQVGTHIDSPAHLFKGHTSADELSIPSLIAPICVVDVRKKVDADPTYKMSMEDVNEYQALYGKIPRGAFLVARTGWEKYWCNSTQYRNEDKYGTMRFPGISKEVALFYQNKIAGLGIDTLSPDGGDVTEGFPVHEILLKNEKIIIENIAGLGHIPASKAIAFCIPLNIENSTESPARLLGMFEEN